MFSPCVSFFAMKRANTWAGFVLFGIWLTSSAVADPGRAFQRGGFHFRAAVGANFRGAAGFRNTALVRDATISRQAIAFRRTALVRDATISRQAAAFRRTALVRDATGLRGFRGGPWRRGGGYADGAGFGGPGFYDYADPYLYSYLGNYLYPNKYGDYESYGYAPGGDPEAADSVPPVTTSVGLVAAVQNKLTRQAYYDGPLNGAINDQTRRAIREYQADHGLSINGQINPELLSSMAIRYVSPLS
jgi:Putative peptidoglycan binding domain